MNEAIHEFLVETHENLAQLDLDLVALEKQPSDRELLSRVFRTMHTVKGTAGFLGLKKLQAVSHAAESMLSRLRDGEMVFNVEIASAILTVVDAVRRMLESVEASETDGQDDFHSLIQTLERLRETKGVALESSAPRPTLNSQAIASVKETPVSASTTQVQATSPLPSTTLVHDASEPRTSAVSDSSIRVDVGLLDKLMTIVGELVLARNQLVQFSATLEDSALSGTVQRLNLLTTELQAGVMKTRMQPIGGVWSKFPRIVRDLALACGKQIHFESDGHETELDKSIIEAIRDPLTHLVRNAVDHGIETPAERIARGKSAEGRLALHAYHEGGKVILEIVDDGKGIDPQRIRAKAIQAKLVTAEQADRLNDRELVDLIFLAGFSTAETVTQFSGRGVGMDVVRTNIERIGGSVTIYSMPGRGTTITMKIPLTLAIIPALTITSAGDRYAIPQVSLLELVRLEGANAGRSVEWIQGAPVYRLRGNLLPLVYLNRELKVDEVSLCQDATIKKSTDDAIHIVVLQADDRQFGLIVDAIHDTQEIVVKPLQKQVKEIGVFAGATIMGDGKVALILDVLGLAQRANVISGVRERSLKEKRVVESAATENRETILLFATHDGGRMALPLSLVARLEEFPRAAFERVGPVHVVQYRNEILPLIHVAKALRKLQPESGGSGRSPRRLPVRSSSLHENDPVQVIVHANGRRRVGLIVDRIIDIAEQAEISRSPSHRSGVLFTAVIQGRVTEFLDLEAVMGVVEPGFIEDPQPIAVGV